MQNVGAYLVVGHQTVPCGSPNHHQTQFLSRQCAHVCVECGGICGGGSLHSALGVPSEQEVPGSGLQLHADAAGNPDRTR